MSRSEAPIDCAILGAGVAGLSAALWAETYALEFRWLDRSGAVGGILERVENELRNVVGGDAEDGAALQESLRRQVDRRESLAPEPIEIESLTFRDDLWWVSPAEEPDFTSKTVVLATGTEFRQLDVPGEREGMGEYVSQSTSRDAEAFGGRTVAIVGGGDAGFEGALQLAAEGSHVHLVLRSEPSSARDQFVDPVRSHPRIFVHPIPSTVERIDEIPSRDSCRLTIERPGRRLSMEVAALFVRIGVDPVYPTIEPRPETDADNYVEVDRAQRTSSPRLYAAGDVTDTPLPSVAVSVGGGAKALYAAADALGRT